VQLVGDHVRVYRIVAPTEWNFHPQGALAQGLVDAPAAAAPGARQLALRLVQSLDPCVSCSVEVTDA
jgi:uptake hydrogenase large subunit